MMDAIMAPVHRWTRQQYEEMVLHDIFQPGERVELVDGLIIDMSPQKSFHASTVCLVAEALQALFGAGHHIRVQMPLALGGNSEPEPDVAVVPGKTRDYVNAHPTTATLVVAVADTTLRLDRKAKQAVYARNGIAEYWIVNLKNNTLEVYREPQGDHYQAQTLLNSADSVYPLAAPDHGIIVADLLP